MQVKVFYEYDASLQNPFVAKCWQEDKCIHGVSKLGFDDAKAELMKKLRAQQFSGDVPEPETVEV